MARNQEALRINENVALLALDLPSRAEGLPAS